MGQEKVKLNRGEYVFCSIDNLTFRPFRIGVGQPKAVVGSDLVLYLVEDNVYITVKFTSWSQGQKWWFCLSEKFQIINYL